ncbi:MAG TPA: GNAT family N-acetyltransferase [Ktedonobacteraceae bacterium]|jgi:GNAT superfamily N-acetyltransferase
MVTLLPVENAADRQRFCQLPGLSTLTPQIVERSRADAHWMLLERDNLQARCSLWWTHTPGVPDHRPGLIGHYAAGTPAAARQLLQFVCEQLARQGCTLAVGPLDGNTSQRYRLLSERGSEPLFFLEPDNPDDWPEHFSGYGFWPLAHYYSALQTELAQIDPRVPALTRHFAAEGLVIRALAATHFEEELQRIYRVVAASFQHNVLASPLSEADFLLQNRLLQLYIRPELVLLAERAGDPLGFVLALPDWCQAQRGEVINTVIIKTLAVHPGARRQGLATLLMGLTLKTAHDLGYTRAIHALMHEDNYSRLISQTNGGRLIRRYTLYARPLEHNK